MKVNRDPNPQWVRDRTWAAAYSTAKLFAVIAVAMTIAECEWVNVVSVSVAISAVWFYFRLPRWPGFWCVHCSIWWLHHDVCFTRIMGRTNP